MSDLGVLAWAVVAGAATMLVWANVDRIRRQRRTRRVRRQGVAKLKARQYVAARSPWYVGDHATLNDELVRITHISRLVPGTGKVMHGERGEIPCDLKDLQPLPSPEAFGELDQEAA